MLYYSPRHEPRIFFNHETLGSGVSLPGQTLAEILNPDQESAVFACSFVDDSGQNSIVFVSDKSDLEAGLYIAERINILANSQIFSGPSLQPLMDRKVEELFECTVMGNRALIIALERPFSEKFRKNYEKFIASERAIEAVELRLSKCASSFSHHLDLSQRAFGKICLAFDTDLNQIVLYGHMSQDYLNLLSRIPVDESSSNDSEVLRTLIGGQNNLDRLGIYHRRIQPPQQLSNFFMLGGGCALIEPEKKIIYVNGTSGNFGAMSSQALIACLRSATDFNLNLGSEVITTREGTYFVGRGRHKFAESFKNKPLS